MARRGKSLECESTSDAANDSGRKIEERLDEFKDTSHRNTDQAEWKQHQPNKWIGNQCDQGEGPAQDQKNEPQQKFRHE